ncbi:hypothetical protein [Haloarcula pelagica]|uniref:hypothetical protein n=1 Tax=Haloarcula pelagica TaxID=3033389 RepID=UPI0024C34FA3|nr:hypothetical protein [Halomicroarcula sp. YJ-61-S]
MIDWLKSGLAWATVVVMVLWSVTHACGRVACVRYPWAGALPGLELVEAGVVLLAAVAIAAVAVDSVRSWIGV